MRNAIDELRSGTLFPSEKCLDAISRLKSFLPTNVQYRHLTLLQGLVQSTVGNWGAFHTLSRDLVLNGIGPEATFQLARCALHNGEPDVCSRYLRDLDSVEQRVARLRIAQAASAGDWLRAAGELDQVAFDEAELGLKAAILLQAGKSDDLLQMSPNSAESLCIKLWRTRKRATTARPLMQYVLSLPLIGCFRQRAVCLGGYGFERASNTLLLARTKQPSTRCSRRSSYGRMTLDR